VSSPRRFPPPWSVEELDACFVVKDHADQKLAYVYFEDEPGAAFSRKAAQPRASCWLSISSQARLINSQ
jgi:hypothetical protein